LNKAGYVHIIPVAAGRRVWVASIKYGMFWLVGEV
jgi:hypothetical protein